ncbi:MAG TPA: hypothetical protein VGH49_10110 [Xanthobacteraceae bacterium]|jgi:hypothetical protein
MKRLTITLLAICSLLASAPAFAQQQGSNQAADYALSWGAAAGGYGGYARAYARSGYEHKSHRRDWR